MNIIDTLLDMPNKTRDGLATKWDLIDFKIQPEPAPKVGQKALTFLLHVTLSRDEKRQVCKILSEIKVLEGYSSNTQNLVSLEDLKLVGLKSEIVLYL